MMVIFVSQCEKKALKRTRRVLDAFADRIGDNTWQTVITEEGLQTVKNLLRKTASKNTAVSCHWIRTRARSDLLWVVGQKNIFDYRGMVAVNRTKRNILHSEWENNWHYISSIQTIATLAALLHDIGKSTLGFQNKLHEYTGKGDPYRHEWISLKLFEALIKDCDTDEQWLSRFQKIDTWLKHNQSDNFLKNCNQDNVDISTMPPLAQWVAWLIATHHRLPPFKKVYYTPKAKEKLRGQTKEIKPTLLRYYEKYFQAFDYWVKNPKTLDESTESFCKNFWQYETLVIHSPEWQKHLARWSKKALQDSTLNQLALDASNDNACISDAFLMYLSRLCLMVGDHNYSSLPIQHKRCATGSREFSKIIANTTKNVDGENQAKQALDEHLIGVANFSAQFAHRLPIIANELPSLKNQSSLSNPTTSKRFGWQNKAFELAKNIQQESQKNGFFGVNMASTGCGKTIGNARIMYGLADPKKGARFIIALGLRVLTLQTGQSLRKDLRLNESQLAILVGGQAQKQLFEFNQESTAEKQEITGEKQLAYGSTWGSESSDELIDEMVHSDIDYSDYDALNLGTIIENSKMRDLLFAPVITCTIDHIIQASECKRGGKYIAPMLRLLSGDLVLDEPDDFDQDDLPALSRLVHLAGLFGSRVLLSSATLTPDLVTGLFSAYQAGRKQFNKSQNTPEPQVVCAWFDENSKNISSVNCNNNDDFSKQHQNFVKKRADFLAEQPVRRKAEIMPLSLDYIKENAELFYSKLGQEILYGAERLHSYYHQVEPNSQKQVSIGLVRIANIKNIIGLAKQLFETVKVSDDTHIHLSCYHAKQLLILRNALEVKLDRILHREEDSLDALFSHKEINNALNKSDARKHIFIVLATSVAEVGRDHDYDWAIVEPSSMRSIIQLAGRIWRHRQTKIANEINMLVMQHNIRYFTRRMNQPVFTKPGFESKYFKPTNYDVHKLVPENQLEHIDARPRIEKPTTENPSQKTEIDSLCKLEHEVMGTLLNSPNLNFVNAYWDTQATANRAHTHLQQISEFRVGTPQEDFLLLPDTDATYPESIREFLPFYTEDVFEKKHEATPQSQYIRPLDYTFNHPQISPWLITSLVDALNQLKEKESDKSLKSLSMSYNSVSLESNQNGWCFHEFFGFMRN
ncbi:type I-F CRISPR-associated helicase Cas3f [Suttonella sp. R2A3]|uniref:type I-F CRISPR-associated helicase Cas3f n=1 Tax=Suttonella sp. R2A3 TaxID=2908648 RepID=UPI001F368DDA|nr:type I-F CRISPR-associated helicase Cas3f [Suttonella sp. R2A3]UJF25015.1 type I-F CRISPR-associated helicase Cas3f [Suttonella sp. R2A3]